MLRRMQRKTNTVCRWKWRKQMVALKMYFAGERRMDILYCVLAAFLKQSFAV